MTRSKSHSRMKSSEARRHTRAVGSFLDGNSALLLVCARLRHIIGKTWGTKPTTTSVVMKLATELI